MKIYTNGLYCVAEYKLKGLLGENILNKITGYEEMDITELNNIPVDIVTLKQLINNTFNKLSRYEKEKILKF